MFKFLEKKKRNIKKFFAFLKTYERYKNNHFAHLPGNYYSPVTNLDWIAANITRLYDDSQLDISGIDINAETQIELFEELSKFFPDYSFPNSKEAGYRYYSNNEMFGHPAGIILYSIMRYLSPKRIVEVGSGFSSALMLDVNDLFFSSSPIKFTFIEPYPDRLYSILKEKDKRECSIVEDNLQNVPLSIFSELKKNDILFVDSSHVCKTGSDVNDIFFKILPVLSEGAYVHFHDIFWPFEYPKEWLIDNKWSWNEVYFLRAFLQYNRSFEIVFFNDYFARKQSAIRCKYRLPEMGGTSIWLRKKVK